MNYFIRMRRNVYTVFKGNSITRIQKYFDQR